MQRTERQGERQRQTTKPGALRLHSLPYLKAEGSGRIYWLAGAYGYPCRELGAIDILVSVKPPGLALCLLHNRLDIKKEKKKKSSMQLPSDQTEEWSRIFVA